MPAEKDLSTCADRSPCQIIGRTRRVADTIGVPQDSARQSGAQIRLGLRDLLAIQNFNRNVSVLIEPEFSLYLSELFFIGGDPQSATGQILSPRRKLCGKFAPQRL